MSRRIHWLLVALTLFGVGCDHATKRAAEVHLAGQRVVDLIPGVLDLRYTQNHDVAFRLLHWFDGPGKAPLLLAAPSVALIAIAIVWWKRRRESSVELVAYALLISGALGNLLDRAVRGFVVDFIHLHYWPVFNVADIAVVVGVGLLAVSVWRASRVSTA